MKRTASQGAALVLTAKMTEAMRTETTDQWGSCAGVRRSPSQGAPLAVAAKAREMMEVHRMLAHPSEEITQETAETTRIATTDQWESCEVCLQAETKRRAVQWIVGPDKTGSGGVGNEDLGEKPGTDELTGRRETTQIEVQEPEPLAVAGIIRTQTGDTWSAAKSRGGDRRNDTVGAAGSRGGDTGRASNREKETRETPPDPKKKTQEALLDPAEKTREAPPDPEEETRDAPPDSEETKDVAGLAAGSTDLGGPVVPALRMLTMSGNIPPNTVIAPG